MEGWVSMTLSRVGSKLRSRKRLEFMQLLQSGSCYARAGDPLCGVAPKAGGIGLQKALRVRRRLVAYPRLLPGCQPTPPDSRSAHRRRLSHNAARRVGRVTGDASSLQRLAVAHGEMTTDMPEDDRMLR